LQNPKSPQATNCPIEFKIPYRRSHRPGWARNTKRKESGPNHVIVGYVGGPVGRIPGILLSGSHDQYKRAKSDTALSTWQDIYNGTGTLPLPTTTNMYIYLHHSVPPPSAPTSQRTCPPAPRLPHRSCESTNCPGACQKIPLANPRSAASE
jgi:hypothetical protein